jgi:hypothetical protein
VAILNLLPRFCILIVLDIFEFHRLVVPQIVRFHYRVCVFFLWKFIYLISLVINLLFGTFFLSMEIETHWFFRVFDLFAFILILVSIVVVLIIFKFFLVISRWRYIYIFKTCVFFMSLIIKAKTTTLRNILPIEWLSYSIRWIWIVLCFFKIYSLFCNSRKHLLVLPCSGSWCNITYSASWCLEPNVHILNNYTKNYYFQS